MLTSNHFHNILKFFDVLPNFPFTTSETMRDYYLQTWYILVASQGAELLKTPRHFRRWGGLVPTQEKKKKNLGSQEIRKYQESI